MRLILLSAAAASLVAACGQSDTQSYAPEAPRSEAASGGFFEAERNAPAEADRRPAGAIDGSNTSTVDTLETAGVLLAYSHYATIELPARNVRTVIAAHEDACSAAGVAVCQVLGAAVSEHGEDYVAGTLRLRAEPGWLEGFRNGLSADAEAADGRVSASSVNAEDLTRAIVDTEARLRAKRTLRERLENLLERQQGDISDLLQVERELARVQAEIDSADSTLTVMRRRVDMSTLDISYQSQARVLSSSAFQPVVNAFNDFFGVFAQALAAIVTVTAGLLPFVILAIPFLWLLRRWLRSRRSRKLAEAAAVDNE